MHKTEIVTLCGSVRFAAEHLGAHRRLSLEGSVVLLPALPASDGKLSTAEVDALHVLHRQKIDMSDRVHIVNPGGYVGLSTKSEIHYAKLSGKRVTYEFEAT